MAVSEAGALSSAAVRELNKPPLEASTLPPQAYWSPELYERELEFIFRREWICVGRVEDIPAVGDYFTTTIANEPLILVRGADGKVHAHVNVCRHRGCELVSGAGKTKSFRCPYHGWMYALDGELRATPDFNDTEDFTKGDYPLHGVRTEIWQGFIFININPAASSLAERVTDMSRWEIDKYALGDKETTHKASWDVACNWKAYIDNAMEEYHTPWVHGETLQPIMPMKGWKEFPDISDQPWTVLIGQFPGLCLSPTGEPRFPIPEAFAEIDPEFDGLPIVNIFPNLVLVCSADSMYYMLVDPTGVESMKVTLGLCVPKESARAFGAGDPATVEAAEWYWSMVPPFMVEDNDACEAQQRGLRSRAAGAGRYCKHEILVWRFANWIVETAYGGVSNGGGHNSLDSLGDDEH
jgi:phenylpropionate dioxygenase-like ring-hydroxylating dioxygenase large terminal subunit